MVDFSRASLTKVGGHETGQLGIVGQYRHSAQRKVVEKASSEVLNLWVCVGDMSGGQRIERGEVGRLEG